MSREIETEHIFMQTNKDTQCPICGKNVYGNPTYCYKVEPPIEINWKSRTLMYIMKLLCSPWDTW